MISTLRTLALTLIGALLVIGVAAWFALTSSSSEASGSDPLALPSPLVAGGLVAAGVVVHLLVEATGYRTTPIAPGTPPEQAATASAQRFQATMISRFAYCDAVAIVALALAFVVESGGLLTYVVGALVSLVLLRVHVWPGARPIARVRASLEREGADAHLEEGLGLPPEPTGPVQRL